jgi:hypothetical protein
MQIKIPANLIRIQSQILKKLSKFTAELERKEFGNILFQLKDK